MWNNKLWFLYCILTLCYSDYRGFRGVGRWVLFPSISGLWFLIQQSYMYKSGAHSVSELVLIVFIGPAGLFKDAVHITLAQLTLYFQDVEADIFFILIMSYVCDMFQCNFFFLNWDVIKNSIRQLHQSNNRALVCIYLCLESCFNCSYQVFSLQWF